MVDEASAVIDGSEKIGIEKRHREMQRFTSPNDKDYKDMLWYIRNWITSSQQLASGTTQVTIATADLRALLLISHRTIERDDRGTKRFDYHE